MGWGLRGKAQRLLERAMNAAVPETAFIGFVAFHTIRRHKRVFGTYPNLVCPKTFSEKLLHRMLFDRRPILTNLQDKYTARRYVVERIGEHVLPTLYWITKDPMDIPFDDLPDKFVVKATHGCGWNYLVSDKKSVDRQDLIDKCTGWLNWNYYYRSRGREWAYKNIEPRILVEEFVSDDTGLSPRTYLLYVFNGQVQMISVTMKRFEPGPTRRPTLDLRADCYAPSWDLLNMKTRFKSIGQLVPRPPHLDEMIKCAERLGNGLDFVRIDFYDARKVYFGEMAVYPSGGLEFYDPMWNRHFGELWDLSLRRNSLGGQKPPPDKKWP
jgi:TupA-like ATPgrasp